MEAADAARTRRQASPGRMEVATQLRWRMWMWMRMRMRELKPKLDMALVRGQKSPALTLTRKRKQLMLEAESAVQKKTVQRSSSYRGARRLSSEL